MKVTSHVGAMLVAILCFGCGNGSGENCETFEPGSDVACETAADCPDCAPICAANGFDEASAPFCAEVPGFGNFCDCTCRICYDS